MHYLWTENSHKTWYKCIKIKEYYMSATSFRCAIGVWQNRCVYIAVWQCDSASLWAVFSFKYDWIEINQLDRTLKTVKLFYVKILLTFICWSSCFAFPAVWKFQFNRCKAMSFFKRIHCKQYALQYVQKCWTTFSIKIWIKIITSSFFINVDSLFYASTEFCESVILN